LAPTGRLQPWDRMKPRARRVTIGAAMLGTAIVTALVIVNWRTVRDHVEAWHFQLTRETETIEPEPALKQSPREFIWALGDDMTLMDMRDCFLVLATYSGLKVIFDSATDDEYSALYPLTPAFPCWWVLPLGSNLTAASSLDNIQANGWRVLQQRIPRRAYVVIREDHARGRVQRRH